MADIPANQKKGSSRWAIRGVVLLALAVGAAGSAALLLTRWVDTQIAIARVPTESVVVAATDLPVGTRITLEQLQTVDWPAASRPASALADPASLQGQIVSVHIYKGEAVLPGKLVSAKAGGDLSALLPEGARAVSVRVDDVVGVAGFVHPGDSVDVIVTLRPEGGSSSPFTSKIILQDIRVLAVGKEVDARARGGDKASPATVATLQVDSVQAERLALAASRGQLLLALRNAADTQLVQTRGIVPSALLASGEPAPAVVEKVAEPPPAVRTHVITRVVVKEPPKPEPKPEVKPAPKPEKEVVEILRGDLFERRNFEKSTEASP